MQINCPSCHRSITAENANIQHMTAICPACHTAFSFGAPQEKPKRRRTRKPDKLMIKNELGNLQMAFHTNFRLDRCEAFINNLMGVGITSMILAIILHSFFTLQIPLLVPVLTTVIVSLFAYRMALAICNQTHIEVDYQSLSVSRKPLFSFLSPSRNFDLDDVVAINCEETRVSVEREYTTPRFRVYAETIDGRHRTLVTNLIEDYAHYVTQRLQEQLYRHMDRATDVSRLAEQDIIVDDMPYESTMYEQKMNR